MKTESLQPRQALAEIEAGIEGLLERIRALMPQSLYEPIAYALLGGGKRVRPVLTLLAADAFGISSEVMLESAVALECIHTYSLIHDDLPELDNDATRRGRETVHVKFSHAAALLAGDALLNLGHTLWLEEIQRGNLTPDGGAFLSSLAGINGMVSGQARDVFPASEPTQEDILTTYSQKTAALIKCALFLPYYSGSYRKERSEKTEYALWQCAEGAGIVFQLRDDLLEEPDKTEQNFFTLFGKERTEERICFYHELLCDGLKTLNWTEKPIGIYLKALTTRMF